MQEQPDPRGQASGRAWKDQPPDPLGVSGGERDREESAHRGADQVDLLHAETVRELEQPARRVRAKLDEAVVVGVGQAEPGAIGDNDRPVEPRRDICPLNGVADAAVDEHGRARPLAADQRV